MIENDLSIYELYFNLFKENNVAPFATDLGRVHVLLIAGQKAGICHAVNSQSNCADSFMYLSLAIYIYIYIYINICLFVCVHI